MKFDQVIIPLFYNIRWDKPVGWVPLPGVPEPSWKIPAPEQPDPVEIWFEPVRVQLAQPDLRGLRDHEPVEHKNMFFNNIFQLYFKLKFLKQG